MSLGRSSRGRESPVGERRMLVPPCHLPVDGHGVDTGVGESQERREKRRGYQVHGRTEVRTRGRGKRDGDYERGV